MLCFFNNNNVKNNTASLDSLTQSNPTKSASPPARLPDNQTAYTMACPAGHVAFFPESGTNDFQRKLCVDAAQFAALGLGNITELVEGELTPADGALVGYDLNTLWLLVAGAMVFLMQAGFMLLEAGSVSVGPRPRPRRRRCPRRGRRRRRRRAWLT